eukprot:g6868.t1
MSSSSPTPPAPAGAQADESPAQRAACVERQLAALSHEIKLLAVAVEPKQLQAWKLALKHLVLKRSKVNPVMDFPVTGGGEDIVEAREKSLPRKKKLLLLQAVDGAALLLELRQLLEKGTPGVDLVRQLQEPLEKACVESDKGKTGAGDTTPANQKTTAESDTNTQKHNSAAGGAVSVSAEGSRGKHQKPAQGTSVRIVSTLIAEDAPPLSPDVEPAHPDAATATPDLPSRRGPRPRDFLSLHGVTLRVPYAQLSCDEALRMVLPEGATIPSSFETVGHLAHLNLHDDTQLRYRYEIGRILLDKNPSLRSVYMKTSTLKNEFRTFPMALLAGADCTLCEVKEDGLRLRLDFRKVYWNSRLSQERQRLLQTIQKAQRQNKKIVLLDMFAGVGAFAILVARDVPSARVLANDLNPESVKWMRENAERNLGLGKAKGTQGAQNIVPNFVASNDDARDFARQNVANVLDADEVHVVMNLPELAIEFLDVFRGLLARGSTSSRLPEFHIHCHCFAPKEDYEAGVRGRVAAALGIAIAPADRSAEEEKFLAKDLCIREVRNIAPKKNKYCVEGVLPEWILTTKSGVGKEMEERGSESDGAKKRRLQETGE